MKILFVTWWVLSGIGKGISAASIGTILKSAGFKIFSQKFDWYLNVDPGTMNPTQHGEVFVTDDGTETDLDLWHYERFLNVNLTKFSSFTTGKLYEEILFRERRWDYLGATVQIVPHLTDLIEEKIFLAWKDSDILIVEIGWTVGDMENEHFLETARRLRHKLGEKNVQFAHVALLPFLQASKEFKTKPIQHSITALRRYGISPDFLIVRADSEISWDIIKKLAISSGINEEHIISAPTLDSIYKVPLAFHKENFWQKILKNFNLPEANINMKEWEDFIQNIEISKEILHIGIIGKYTNLEDAYFSLNEWLKCAGFSYHHKVKLHFIDAEKIETNTEEILSKLDGICIPWGFGGRAIEWLIKSTQYARENNIPFLGICLGSQIMAIEFARNILHLPKATSEEWWNEWEDFIIHIMDEQKNLTSKGGNMRLGSYKCKIKENSLAHKLYQKQHISERHRHRYEFNNKYREDMEKNGFIISWTSPDNSLVEIVEIPSHPFMIATQAHPEFLSRPTNPHPLFLGFINAIIKHKK